MLRKIFDPKNDDVSGQFRILRNDELRGAHRSPGVDWIVRYRRLRWAGHVTRIVRQEFHKEFWRRSMLEDRE